MSSPEVFSPPCRASRPPHGPLELCWGPSALAVALAQLFEQSSMHIRTGIAALQRRCQQLRAVPS
eukprot:798779-Alexandrium_andersonii.AAC.1